MLDTRREVLRHLKNFDLESRKSLTKVVLCIVFAFVIALIPEYTGLTDAGRWALFILILGAGLWISEAIPSFAVALLIIALEIMILGRPGGVFADDLKDWEMFVRPWSSPIMWLFFGGFVLSEAAQVTGLDRLLARYVLRWFGTKPGSVLFGTMAFTFLFSMFMSNTATTAMMMAVMAPVIISLKKSDPFVKALLLGIPFAANIGGMGTIIGSPPNAIVAGTLMETHPVDFTRWMLAGLPPAIILFLIAWLFLKLNYPSEGQTIDIAGLDRETRTGDELPLWKRLFVMPVFIITVLLWMTGPIHGIPTPVVSFLPITVFAVIGIIRVHEIRQLHWDVLLLLTGGLSLGVAIRETGLAVWLVNQLPIDTLSQMALAFLFSYLTTILSNFMSNTATTNILAPIGIAVATAFGPQILIPIALGASSAMCLPISTPPNAIAYSNENLESRDFFKGGILIGLIGPLVGVIWCYWLFS